MISRKRSSFSFLKKMLKLRNVTRFLPVTGLEGSVKRLNRERSRNNAAEILKMMLI